MRESTPVNKMDTRLRGYDTSPGRVYICKDSEDCFRVYYLYEEV